MPGVFIGASRGEGGSFTCAEVAPGRYDVILSRDDGRWSVLAQDVLVRSGQSTGLGSLTPVLLDPLRLTVLDAAGSPIEAAVVRCPGSPGIPEASTDAEGRCELVLPPGEYAYTVTTRRGVQVQAQLSAGGIETIRVPAGKCSLRIKSTAEGTALRGQASASVEVEVSAAGVRAVLTGA
ncbi:MAG: carboxypeptidase regulatory-like domain-containing protein [Planctomycetes bacterium]|nr:carboxypeptidase regulatory-like domain-containing protein [Planctomycetota bacterium]